MLAAELEAAVFGSMHDPEAAQALHRAGVGAAVTLDVGGKTDPVAGGAHSGRAARCAP